MPINVWSQIEIHIAIICASVPALRVLISSPRRSGTRGATTGATGAPGETGRIRGGQRLTSGHSRRGSQANGVKLESVASSVRLEEEGGEVDEEALTGRKKIKGEWEFGGRTEVESAVRRGRDEDEDEDEGRWRGIGYTQDVEVTVERRGTNGEEMRGYGGGKVIGDPRWG